MNAKLVAIALVLLVVGGIATEALAGLMWSNTTTSPAAPTYVDSVVMDSFAFSGDNSATLNLREGGNATSILTSYKVTDSNGDSYFLSSWSNQTIQPSAVVSEEILISDLCPSCSISGAAFTFVSGHSYTVSLYALDGNQFSFEIARKHFTYQVNLSIGFGANGQG